MWHNIGSLYKDSFRQLVTMRVPSFYISQLVMTIILSHNIITEILYLSTFQSREELELVYKPSVLIRQHSMHHIPHSHINQPVNIRAWHFHQRSLINRSSQKVYHLMIRHIL